MYFNNKIKWLLRVSFALYYLDRVYDSAKDNEEVYEDLCKPIVESVMQGFNGNIFSILFFMCFLIFFSPGLFFFPY